MLGVHFFDDFVGYDSYVASNVGYAGNGWRTYEDNSQSITQVAVVGGVIRIALTDADTECAMQLGGATGAAFSISDTAGADFKLWFEARVRSSTITNTENGFFVGLAGVGAAANTFIADAGDDFASNSLIGFWRAEADGDTVDVIYQKTSGALTTPITDIATPEADTWVKLGFKYDPDKPTAERITFYADGVASSTFVTGTNIATSTFPDAEILTPIFAAKAATNDTETVDMDWIRVAQLY